MFGGLASWFLGFLVSYHETKKPTFLPGFTWLVLGEDPAARSQFHLLPGLLM